MEELKGIDLIELEERLSAFASHHQKKGGNAMLQLAIKTIEGYGKEQARDGSADMANYYKGYDKSRRELIEILKGLLLP